MPRMLTFTFAPLIALALFSTPTYPPFQGTPETSNGIPPVVWQLTKIVPPSGQTLVPEDPAKYTLQFLPDGRVNVRADCNTGSGSYEIDGVELTIDEVALTLKFCGEESLDGQFASTLAFVNSWSVIFDELIITATDGTTLHFVPALTGVVWEWQEFLGGNEQRIAPDDPSRYTITFEDESTFAVRADCNVGSGTYTVDGASIDLIVGALTRAMCPPESLSDQFLRDIDDTASYSFRDGRLFLELKADAGVSMFAAQPISEEGTPTPEEGTPVGG